MSRLFNAHCKRMSLPEKSQAPTHPEFNIACTPQLTGGSAVACGCSNLMLSEWCLVFGGVRWVLPQPLSSVHDGDVKHNNMQQKLPSCGQRGSLIEGYWNQRQAPKTFHSIHHISECPPGQQAKFSSRSLRATTTALDPSQKVTCLLSWADHALLVTARSVLADRHCVMPCPQQSRTQCRVGSLRRHSRRWLLSRTPACIQWHRPSRGRGGSTTIAWHPCSQGQHR